MVTELSARSLGLALRWPFPSGGAVTSWR